MKWLAILTLILTACGGWQVRAAETATALIDGAHAACDKVKQQCIRRKDVTCARLHKCHAMETAAVAAGESLSTSLKASQRALKALEQWRQQ